METIEIGFVHTYPCLLSGDIRSYSQPYGKPALQTPAMRVLGPRAEALYMPVYKLIALLTILPLAYLLYKNPGPFLYIVPSPWRWLMVGGQLIAAIIFPQRFAGCTP